ncbi:MAG: helix-turn-helix domain-containing protein [Saprospiraceae bacterium]
MGTIVYLSITGLFLSLLTLFYNKGYRGANRYLSGFLFFGSYFILAYSSAITTKDARLVAFFSMGSLSVYYLVGPMAFFYVRSILRDYSRLSRWDWLHFVPFLYVLSGIMPYILFTDWEHKVRVASLLVEDWGAFVRQSPNRLLPPLWNEALRLVQGSLYVVLCWALIYRYRTRLFHYRPYSSQVKLIKIWIQLFCAVYTFLIVSKVWQGILILRIVDRATFFQAAKEVNVMAGIFYLLLNVLLLVFPRIFYGMPASLEGEIASGYQPDNTSGRGEKQTGDTMQGPSGAHLRLFSTAYLSRIEESILTWVGEKKHLTAQDSLDNLSAAINIPGHHLSYYFNQVLQIKFTDWKNKLKVEHACSEIRNGVLKKQTVESLALDCGFNSKPTFNRTFKQIVGKTPSEYAEKFASEGKME